MSSYIPSTITKLFTIHCDIQHINIHNPQLPVNIYRFILKSTTTHPQLTTASLLAHSAIWNVITTISTLTRHRYTSLRVLETTDRRNDVIFSPRIGSFGVRQFLSFIQADGYEPLTVEAMAYMVQDPAQAARVAGVITSDPQSAATLGAILGGGTFRPGQLFTISISLENYHV